MGDCCEMSKVIEGALAEIDSVPWIKSKVDNV